MKLDYSYNEVNQGGKNMDFLGIGKKIDKSQPGWRELRSTLWNWLCKTGAEIGEIGKRAGPIMLEAGKDALLLAAEILLPKAFEQVADMVAKFTPKGIAFAQGLIKKVDELNIPGIDKMIDVAEEMVSWLEAEGKKLTTTEIKTFLQNIFYTMRKEGEI